MTNDTLLRWALRGNAAFSALTGAVAVVGARSLAPWLGIAWPAVLVAIGVGLWGFAAALVWLASRPQLSPVLAWAVVAADLGWVAGSVPLVLADLLTPRGDWLAMAVAEGVLLFAALQAVGTRRMTAEPDSRQPV